MSDRSWVSLSCAATFSVRFSAKPAVNGAGACAPRTNSPDTWQDFCPASPRSQQWYQLPLQSQPAVSTVWQMTLTSANMRTFSRLTHTPAVEGGGWWVEVRVWRMQGLFSDCIVYSTSLGQTRTGKLPWWHRSARPLRTYIPTVTFST